MWTDEKILKEIIATGIAPKQGGKVRSLMYRMRDEMRDVVELLQRPDASLYVGDYVLVHGDQCWHVGSINDFGGAGGVYTGDLAGAVEAMRKAVSDE